MKKIKNRIPNGAEMHPDKLTSTDKQFSTVLDSLWEGVQIIDFSWRYVYVNNMVAGYEQTTKENLQGRSILERYPGIEHTDVFEGLELGMLERTANQVEIEFAYPDQSRKWFQLRIEPVEEGIMVLSMDISRRKETDEKIKRSNQLLLFISQVNQKIVRVKDEATLFANACAMALEFGKFQMAWIGLFEKSHPSKIALVAHCGLAAEEIKSFVDSDWSFPGVQENVLCSGMYYVCNDIAHDPSMEAWRPLASKNGIGSCIVLPIKKSGIITGTFNLYASEPAFPSQEEIALLVELTSDISFALDLFEKEKILNEHHMERQRAEEKLILNNEELKKTNSELDRFVYSASHDLRAPLSSVLGLISLIELESKEPDTLTYALQIRKSVNRLEGFIHNILSYSKNNRLDLEVVHIPLKITIKDIIDSLRNSKEAEGVVFSITMDEQLSFYSDIHRFTIILENLISNAIKFQNYRRQERIISITGKVYEDTLRMEVTDNGIGIDQQYLPKIFDMFFRISGEREGSGIGLYIVKETVTKLQGIITVDSNEHTGTAFQVNLKNFAR
ncbi:MAG: hypothetical protein DI538_13870 [Azospira oryzae]|jgi:signal transduction histidine kinase|nr:MAG: hypothetical protein DI538_13870 [Azospira oryzae]